MEVEPSVVIWLPASFQNSVTVQIISCITSVQELKLVHNATCSVIWDLVVVAHFLFLLLLLSNISGLLLCT